jgi:branched-chain amino acid transport system ATP-binding protein
LSGASGLPVAEGEQLVATGVRVNFGGIKALDGVDLVLNRGGILGLIGPNGAGKTTLVNVLTGFQRPTDGTVVLAGVDVARWSANRIARRGVARTFQNVRLFSGLSVHENIELGALGVGSTRGRAKQRAWELLERMELTAKGGSLASSLPHGEARRVGILRALAMLPNFLLLDEPGAGLNETEVDDLVGVLRRIREDFGCGLLVIEHDMRLIMELCESIHVLDHGRTISIGNPNEVKKDPAVLAAYLGKRAEPRNGAKPIAAGQ